MTTVDVFGTVHVDRPSKVKAELVEFSQGHDVLFVEAPRQESDESDRLALVLRNPIMVVTGRMLDLVWGLSGFFLTLRWGPVDRYVTDVVSQERDLDVEPVDMNLVRRASDVRIWVTVVSWFALSIAAVLFVFGVLSFSLALVTWAFAVAFAPVLPFAYGTLSERDKRMAENIEHVCSTREDVTNGCLVVGRGHVDGVVDELVETDVEVGERHTSKFFRRNA